LEVKHHILLIAAVNVEEGCVTLLHFICRVSVLYSPDKSVGGPRSSLGMAEKREKYCMLEVK
jgi:hypothetical protein